MSTPHPSEQFTRIGAAAAPGFSRDGRTLFHLRGAGLPQPWAMDLATGDARPLATHDEKVAFLRRAPKSDALIYGTDRGGDERQALWLLEPGAGPRPLTEAPGIIHDFGAWSPDGSSVAYTANDREEAHMDVVVHELGSGERRRVLHGRHETHVVAWHPDGGSLLVAQDHAMCDVRLSVLALGTGEAVPVPRTGALRYGNARWTPDGVLRCITDAHGGDFLALCRLDPATGVADPVWAPPGRDVEAWSLSPDGRTLATVENDRGHGVLRVGPAAAPERPVVGGLPRGVVSDLAWSPDSATLAFAAADPVTPPGLWCWTANGVRSLWQPDGTGVAAFELVEWDADGRRVPGWLALPPGPAPTGGHPAVVWVHGGPASQARANFRPDMQFLLAQGYAVLMPNVRGSTGYGRIAMESDDVDRRLDSVADLAAGRHWLAARPGIDPSRIAVMGQSYGGYMVLAAITEYPELWRTAIDFYGIADFGTLLDATGPWRRAHRAAEYGDPVRHRALFDRISPIRHIDRVRAPLLVLHGTRDPRVAIGESEQVVEALRARQQPVRYEVFDYAGHGFIRPDDRVRAYRAVAEFLADTL